MRSAQHVQLRGAGTPSRPAPADPGEDDCAPTDRCHRCVDVLLAGCSSASGSVDTVAVTGAAGTVPALEFKHPLTVRHPETREIWGGNGPTLGDGASVLMNYIAEDAQNGDLVGETYSTG